MSTLLEFQYRLAEALVSGRLDQPAALFAGEDERRGLGLKVYANNVVHALVTALEDSFPAVRAVMGADVFRTAAIAYVREHPLADPVLMHIGLGFPGFLAQRPDLAGHPALSDLAVFELAWLMAYHAPEADSVTLGDFAAADPARLMRAAMALHPSIHLQKSPWPLDRLWLAARNGEEVEPCLVPEAAPTCFLIYRPEADVLVARLSPALFAALNALQAGQPFGEAAAMLDPAADLSAFQALVADGLFVRLELPGE